jgi:hypothetical protein
VVPFCGGLPPFWRGRLNREFLSFGGLRGTSRKAFHLREEAPMNSPKSRLDEAIFVLQCIANKGDARARFYLDYRDVVAKTIRMLLGVRAADKSLRDEVADLLWFFLVRRHWLPLARFDPRRGKLATYLRLLARRMLGQLDEQESCRERHEGQAPAPASSDDGADDGVAWLMLDQFIASLPPHRREQFLQALAIAREQTATATRSREAIRKRQYRWRKRLEAFLAEAAAAAASTPSVTSSVPGDPGGGITTYTYDALGSRLAPPAELVTTYTYDALGRPDGGYTSPGSGGGLVTYPYACRP